MSKQLTPFSIDAPGFYGINTQDSSLDMNPAFALEAVNCVIDQFGRIGARKGWEKSTTTSVGGDIECIGELVTNAGVQYILVAGNNKLYKKTSDTLTELIYGGGGVAPTITASNWHFDSISGVGYFFQRGYDPLLFDPDVSTTTYRRVSEHASYSGTVNQCNIVLSAYGRLWIADTSTDKNTVKWSNTSTGVVWTGGTSGTLNVTAVWPNGTDEITALGAHNGALIIFGKKQILVYTGAHNPTDLTLATLNDTIVNIGCIARDSVQNTGSDLLFLSQNGVYSLQRVIQERSNPLVDVSKNVRDHLKTDIDTDFSSNIRSVYSDINAFYLLSLPNTGEVYCFDTKTRLEDGSFRVTRWNGLVPKSYLQSSDRTLYFGMNLYLGKYSGYTDNTATYRMKYYTPHISFGGNSSSSILKKITTTMVGGSGQTITFFYGSDYTTNYQSGYGYISTGAVSYFNNAEYFNNLEYFSSGISIETIQLQAGGAGKVLQFGFETDINGYALSIQKIDIFTKVGKML